MFQIYDLRFRYMTLFACSRWLIDDDWCGQSELASFWHDHWKLFRFLKKNLFKYSIGFVMFLIYWFFYTCFWIIYKVLHTHIYIYVCSKKNSMKWNCIQNNFEVFHTTKSLIKHCKYRQINGNMHVNNVNNKKNISLNFVKLEAFFLFSVIEKFP